MCSVCVRERLCVCVCVQCVCDSGCVGCVSEGVWYGVSEGMWYVWLCVGCVRVCGMSVYTYTYTYIYIYIYGCGCGVYNCESVCGMCVCVLSVGYVIMRV